MQQCPGGRMVSGSLAVNGDRLRFEGGGFSHESNFSVEFTLSGLKLRAGGHNDEQLFFEHTAQTDWILTTSDHGIVGQLARVADATLQEHIRAVAGRKSSVASRLMIATVIFFVVVIGAGALLFSQKSRLARTAANSIPIEVEQQLGDAVFKGVQQQMKIIDDPRWRAQLETVTRRLLPAVTNSGYPFRFHVAEAEDLNAFAIPGGHLVVHTGLLKAVKRPEELAGVIAHEMVHVTQRHSLRNLIEALGLSLIVQTLFGDASALVAAATKGSESLLRQKFSRDTEREADDVGWELLVTANLDPRGMIDFFHTMQEELAKNPAAAAADGRLSFLSTHPATAERIARLEAKWKALPRKTDFLRLGTSGEPVLEKP
jgi:beta-barrel assembly-enhancing protease